MGYLLQQLFHMKFYHSKKNGQLKKKNIQIQKKNNAFQKKILDEEKISLVNELEKSTMHDWSALVASITDIFISFKYMLKDYPFIDILFQS